MSKTPRAPKAKATAATENREAVSAEAPAAATEKHKHDFKPNGDVDAGRPVEVCACGERRVEGEPGRSR